MSEIRPSRSRLDQPRETRRLAFRRPDPEADTIGVFAEGFARYMGTARFLFWMTVFVGVWICWNVFAPPDWKFDRYPFIFLTLMLSLQASYAAPLILLAQNRQERRDRVTSENDREVAERTQADTEFLAREIASVRLALSDMVTGEAFDERLERLTEVVEQLGTKVDLLSTTASGGDERSV